MTATGTLARYIAGRFFTAIAAVFLLCFVLIFLFDFMEILRQSGKIGRSGEIPNVSTGLMLWITLLRLPAILELTLPIAVLAGSIGAFLMLSRSSELVVVRAAGISVWQFTWPGLLIALGIGLLAVTVYNPIAATAKAESERLYAEAFGKQSTFMSTKSGAWLAQDGVDGRSVIHARNSAEQGMLLTRVTIFQYRKNDRLIERIDADKAELKDGRWVLTNAKVSAGGRDQDATTFDHYIVSTYLTPTEVRDAIGSAQSISFWDLPNFIVLAEKAGLPATRYKVQYALLMAQPVMIIAMVLLAATCSIRSFRFGNIFQRMVFGIGAGFALYFFVEISRNLGLAGLISPQVSAWVPAVMACLLTSTALLYQEDG